MRGNDIDATVMPSYIVLYDGLLAAPPEMPKAYMRAVRRKRWVEAFDMWTWNQAPLRSLAWGTMNLQLRFMVTTYQPREVAELIDDSLSAFGISIEPVRSIASPDQIRSWLAMTNGVQQVWSADLETVQALGPVFCRACDPAQSLPVR